MTNRDQKAIISGVDRVLRASGLAGLYARFAANVRRSNQPDMPIVTTNRIWFLRENRFLVFTHGGPVEVTLKPSLVLTGVLICMAGVAAIFYSSIIASHSAIGVSRDETIKTAQASTNPIDGAAISRDNTTAGRLRWLDYNLTSLETSHSPTIAKKTAQPPSQIIDRIIAQPSVTPPQIPQISADTKIAASDAMPMIIQDGKRITLASNATSAKPQFADEAGSLANKPRAIDPSPAEIIQISAPTLAPNQNNGEPIIADQRLADQKMTETTAGEEHLSKQSDAKEPHPREMSTDQNLVTVALNPIIENDPKTASITARAQEFAIALLPNFVSAPEDQKTARRQQDEYNDDAVDPARLPPPSPKLPEQPTLKTAALAAKPDMPEADGLLTGSFTQRHRSVLPLVTEAAKTKKMLLALEQEINFIRTTVTGLGISAESLPSQIQLATNVRDDDLKDIMVNLAEHRAALRKIPFKPPMLYFYISSGYGNRKHPKTGKMSFHHGVDLAGTWQENVRVTAPGTVIYAGTEGSFGKVVRVQHDFDIVTTYAHLARITVRLGDYIGENHVVGKMGNTGRSAGAHLHYEVRINNKSIDPVKFMTVGRQISVAGELRQSSLVE